MVAVAASAVSWSFTKPRSRGWVVPDSGCSITAAASPATVSGSHMMIFCRCSTLAFYFTISSVYYKQLPSEKQKIWLSSPFKNQTPPPEGSSVALSCSMSFGDQSREEVVHTIVSFSSVPMYVFSCGRASESEALGSSEDRRRGAS